MYIVLEKFPTPDVARDDNGDVKVFNTIEEANKEANECHDGLVVKYLGEA